METKLKMGFLCGADPTDTKYWSGTIARLHSTLSKSDKLEIKDIIVPQNKLAEYVFKILKRLSGNKNHMSKLMFFWGASKANRIITQSGCDWIFAPACSQIIYLGRKSLRNKKLIYLSDATYHIMLGYYYTHSRHDQEIGNKWERIAHELAREIILPANWAVEDAVNYYGTPAEKINIIKFGANLDDYGYKTFQSGRQTYKLLLVGVDYVRKGVDVAIEAVKRLNETSSIRFELSVVGLNKPDIDIPECVTFYGKLRKNNPEELKKLVECYKNHDIFILPTKAECSAIVFAEAAMFGLPVFTYATGGTVDYVEDGVTGRCFDPKCGAADYAKGIKDAIGSGKMTEFSVNARKKYESELNWDYWLEQFENVISKEK